MLGILEMTFIVRKLIVRLSNVINLLGKYVIRVAVTPVKCKNSWRLNTLKDLEMSDS